MLLCVVQYEYLFEFYIFNPQRISWAIIIDENKITQWIASKNWTNFSATRDAVIIIINNVGITLNSNDDKRIDFFGTENNSPLLADPEETIKGLCIDSERQQ